MSHFTVLVIGAKNEEEIAKMLEPYWELDLPIEEAKNDPRSEFQVECTLKEATEEWEEYKQELPTTEQVVYAFNNFFIRKEESYELELGIASSASFYICEGALKGSWVLKVDEKEFLEWCEKEGVDSWCVKHFQTEPYKDVFDYMKNENHYGYEEGKGFGYYCNPNARWDWHRIGGRWNNFFKLKKDACAESYKGTPSWCSNNSRHGNDRADIVQLRDIDFEGMKEDNRKEAESLWKKAFEKFPDRIEKPTKKEIDANMKDKDFISRIKMLYPELKSKKDLREKIIEELMKRPASNRDFLYGIKPTYTLEDYIERCESFSTFAVLKDGEWYERGKMGWWACVSDEKDEEEWDKQFTELLKDLPSDTYLSLVDCHI